MLQKTKAEGKTLTQSKDGCGSDVVIKLPKS